MFTSGDVREWLPSLTEQEAFHLAAEATAALALYAPCINTYDNPAWPLAQGTIRRILLADEVATTSVGIESETNGPFVTRYVKRGPLLLTDADIGVLRNLCAETSGSAAPGGLPRGTFPAPFPMDGLFVERRR